ncbi:MAG: exodeoxyribonuclease VII large subunit [Defluviitaleaceae bacterium]|nr:exodeoxyribonuclease VII large subunit [Defluviitaleaceae bacterium]
MISRMVFTVTQVNRYVKKALEADALLAGLFIEGELSNFNAHSSGHLYFTLKDAGAAISGVMFKSHAGGLDFMPKSGMKVIAFGHLSLYEKTGQYQLYVEFLEPAGIGGLQLAFAQLKEKLEKEGLFDAARKREIPRFAQTIAVITSPTGAAVQDIIRIIRERNPSVKILISPAIVQGEAAAADLVRAVTEVNEYGKADVIIIGRGGGSIEDLHAFNDETLARAIRASKIPVISAVGHETDFTIADFVADLRAPTPTAAAQIAAFDLAATHAHIDDLRHDLSRAVSASVQARRADIKSHLATLSRAMDYHIGCFGTKLTNLEIMLDKVSPYTLFKRGFALTKITSVKELTIGQDIEITWADGKANATITEIT